MLNLTFHKSFIAALTFAVIPAIAAAQSPKTKAVDAKKPAKPKSGKLTIAPVTGTFYQRVLIDSAAFSPDGEVLFTTTKAARPTIGVSVSPADKVLRAQLPATKNRYGLVVTRVVDKSPAASAGVKVNDVLLTANKQPLAVRDDLIKLVTAKDGKGRIHLRLLRGGREISANVVFDRPKIAVQSLAGLSKIVVWDMASGQRLSKYEIGVHTETAPASLLAHLVLPPGKGRVITSVTDKSPAAKLGLQKHDLIVRIGESYIGSAGDIGKVLDKAAGKPVAIEYYRAGRKQTNQITARKRAKATSGFYYLRSGRLNHVRAANAYSNAIVDFYKSNKTSDRRDLNKRVTLNSQIDSLSRQVGNLQKAVESLKRALAAQNKAKPKK